MIIEFSRNEKLQKYRIIHSQQTNYLQKQLVHFLTCLLVPCLFFPQRDSWICANQEQTGPPQFGFHESGLASLPSWWIQADSVPFNQKFSWKLNFSFFKVVPSNRLSFYLGSPLHIINSLLSHFYLFQKAILHKMLKLGFWNFNPIFLRMYFSLVGRFFSLVLVISLSWYFHLTISYLTLVTWNFGSQMVFPNI